MTTQDAAVALPERAPTAATAHARVPAAARAWVLANPAASVIVGLGLAVRLLFWAVTGRQFEDGLITTTHAITAAEGHGLTHHLGEGHIHGFTSPISVLVPLVGEVLHHGWGFSLLRLSALVAFPIAAFAAYRLCALFEVGRWPTLFVLAYLAFDRNHVFYGMAGMETEIAVAVLLWAIYLVLRERTVPAGILLGLCLYTRPDFLAWVAIALLFLAVRNRRRAAVSGLVALALFAPWLAFTTAYYGSPVPHTIRAKSHVFFDPPSPRHPGAYPVWLKQTLQLHKGSWIALAPWLEDSQVFAAPVPRVALKLLAYAFLGLALYGVVLTLRGRLRDPAIWPVAVYVAAFLAYALIALPATYFEWYQPPLTAVLAILAAIGLTAIGRRAKALATGAAVLLAVIYAIPMLWWIPTEARLQHDVENRVRKPLGLWLRAHVPQGESVTSESAGYVGYYGRVKLYDWPGLTSNAVYDAMKQLPQAQDSLLSTIRLVHPDWIVLRPFELQNLRTMMPTVYARYHVVKAFALPHPIDKPLVNATNVAAVGLPGVVELDRWGMRERNIDQRFFILRKRSLGPVR